MDDVRTVLRAVGSERTAFFGRHLGGRLALLFAATHPRLTTALVTFAAHPTTLRDDDYPWGSTPEQREEVLASARNGDFDPDGILAQVAPSDAGDASTRHWWSMFMHSAATSPEAVDEITSHGPVDIRRPGLRARADPRAAPTGDRFAAVEAAGTWRPTCPARGSSSCRATITCRSPATRRASSPPRRNS